jgi:hypothetical protein
VFPRIVSGAPQPSQGEPREGPWTVGGSAQVIKRRRCRLKSEGHDETAGELGLIDDSAQNNETGASGD